MIFYVFKFILGACILHLLVVQAQDSVIMSTWAVPDGNQPDFSSTFNQSSELQIVWNSIDPSSFESTLSTLWVTTFDFETTLFSQLLAENVDTKDNGKFYWTIAIPSNVLSRAAKYVLRFKDRNSEYTSTSEEDSSPGFIIINGDTTTSSSSSSSSSASSSSSTTHLTITTTTSVIPTTGLTTVPTASAIPQDSKSHGISNGAVAGIAIAAAGTLILIFWLVYFLYKRRQRERKSSICDVAPKQQFTDFKEGPTYISDGKPMELEATELGQRGPVELQG